jgi:hypothetical protein
MRAISFVQQGIVAQFEFANIVTLGTAGRLEVAAPLSDDERRDFEIHIKGDYARGLAIQVKSARHLVSRGGNNYLNIRFAVANARVVKHPRFWYFFAHLDFRKMSFTEPVYLVPSAIVHAHARPMAGSMSEFLFNANLSTHSTDKWTPYRLSISEVGPAVLRVISGLSVALPASAQVSKLTAVPGMVWVKQLPTTRAA